MPTNIRKRLENIYPEYAHIFRKVPVVEPLVPRDLPVPDAVLRVVVSQMLSTASARTIHARVCNLASDRRIEPWRLEFRDLRSCGLSNSKCRTITEFRNRYMGQKADYDKWPNLCQNELLAAITSHWGMSDWTAGILSLSYFGHEDVFPKGDGSLVRAINAMHDDAQTRKSAVNPLDPDLAKPKRSYLAMYLWKALDKGLI